MNGGTILIIIATLTGLLFSCAETGKKPDPGETVLSYVEALAHGRTEEAAAYLTSSSRERETLSRISPPFSLEERFLKQGLARYVSCEIGKTELSEGAAGVEAVVAAPDFFILMKDVVRAVPAEQEDNIEAVVSAGEAVHRLIEKYRSGIPVKKTRGWFRLVREGDAWKIDSYRKGGE